MSAGTWTRNSLTIRSYFPRSTEHVRILFTRSATVTISWAANLGIPDTFFNLRSLLNEAVITPVDGCSFLKRWEKYIKCRLPGPRGPCQSDQREGRGSAELMRVIMIERLPVVLEVHYADRKLDPVVYPTAVLPLHPYRLHVHRHLGEDVYEA